MALRIVLFVSFSILASACLLWFYQTYHPLVLASEESRNSIDVTVEQLNELNNAERLSDMISFALLGGVLSGGLALISGTTKSPMSMYFGLFTGLVLGAVAGAAAGFIGHWFDDAPIHPDLRSHDVLLFAMGVDADFDPFCRGSSMRSGG
jgi:hypothetical protein